MFPSVKEAQYSQKRKHFEFRDPDYANVVSSSTSAKRQCAASANISSTSYNNTKNTDASLSSGSKYQKMCDIITREFQHEIDIKHQQLELIDDRLNKAFHLLDRLRYAIVADYYRKQTLVLPPAEAAAVRGTQTLFDEEHSGPQMAMHPSLKKIIGKKPKTYEEILRSCPMRAAAQTAKQTILIKSQVHKKREKRLLQLIRDEGIVIDHSKEQNPAKASLEQQLSIVDVLQQGTSKQRTGTQPISPVASTRLRAPAAVKSLNATRLNNKIKHLIIVGNTSKYISNNTEEQDVKSTSKKLSHKWLVYVQAKDSETPLNLFVKKVRFFLHSSYRPNDVVDIHSPPYQIARRGWGEFPVRIQMFFKDALQQKPVQLVHHLVLDKTLSGLQTLGSETLVEIWLRSDLVVQTLRGKTSKCRQQTANIASIIKDKKPVSVDSLPNTIEQNRKISFSQSKEIDDNLFEFLNKIEESPTSICDDIEKIQPTVMVTESMPNLTHNVPKLQKQAGAKFKTVNANSISVPNSACSINFNTHILNTSVTKDSYSAAKSIIAKKPYPFKQPQQSTFINSDKIQLQPSIDIRPNIKAKTTNFLHIDSSPNETHTSGNFPKILANNKAIIVSQGQSMLSNNTQMLKSVMGKPMLAQPCISQANNRPAIAKPMTVISSNPQLVQSLTSKKFLQKKLVQLVDADGNVKYLQMLVATSRVPPIDVAGTSAQPVLTTARNANLQAIVNTQSSNAPIVHPLVLKQKSVSLKPTELLVPEVENIQKETIVKPLAPNAKRLPCSLPSNASSPSLNNNQTKNIVFQRGGKVYIIDPMQVKLKQQQKKQVSLLKPQISLLKQKSQQQTPTICDHDYIPAPSQSNARDIKDVNIKTLIPSVASRKIPKIIANTPFQSNTVTTPQLHLGLRQARANANNIFELSQRKRIEIGKQFLTEKFVSVRQAVEYLLRRIPLVRTQAANSTLSVSVYPFLTNSIQHFNSLPAFKQRAHEWMRAKLIAKSLKSHENLQKLIAKSGTLWSTREIAMFARFHAYTPPIKGLNNFKIGEGITNFTDLVKHEVKNKGQIQYETMTKNTRISNWVESVSSSVAIQQVAVTENQMIDIENIDEPSLDADQKTLQLKSPQKYLNSNEIMYLSTPDRLVDASQLASDICKDSGLRLQPEEICSGVVHPMTQTIMAKCLTLFVENLLRQVLASKAQKKSIENHNATNVGKVNYIEPLDIAKVIDACPEFDFLSNRHMGTIKCFDEFTEKK